MAFKLPVICNSLLFAYNFNWCSNCLQFTINLRSALQLQLEFKLPAICNPLLFDYNFNWHSNCLPFTINLLFAKLLQLAFILPAICNQLLFDYNFNWHTNCLKFALRCSLITTSNVIQRAAICNLFALCLQLLLACKCPQFAIRLLFA